jgi:hypothetical protein
MSLFSNLLTGPLYCLITEIDETGKQDLEAVEILEVWGVLSDGTLVCKDTSKSPWKLDYLRIDGDPELYFSQHDAEQALEQTRNKQ